MTELAVAARSRPAESRVQQLRIVYAIQNVGGVDLAGDMGDAVPIKHTLRGLKRAGHDVTLLRLQEQRVLRSDGLPAGRTGSWAPLPFTGSMPFRRIEGAVRRVQRLAGLPYFALFDSARFYEACRQTLPGNDLCHEHNGMFSIGAALACRRLGIPYVLTFSADPFIEKDLVGAPLRGLHRALARWEAGLTCRTADRILCVSEPAKRHLVVEWGVEPDKIVVMPNGVDTELFRPHPDSPQVRAELGLGPGPVVMFVGGLHAWHGVPGLVRSFGRVRAEIPDAELVIVGDGPERSRVMAEVDRQDLTGSVTLTGIVPQPKIPEFLGVAAVATLPYPKLPQELWFSPLKLYEYMACGKAIVASGDGQIGQVIEHGRDGLLVPPGDWQALSAAIIRLLQDSALRRNLGQRARGNAAAAHTWTQYVGRLEAVYTSVLAGEQ